MHKAFARVPAGSRGGLKMDSVSHDLPDDKVSGFDEGGRNFLLLKRRGWMIWVLADPMNGLAGLGDSRGINLQVGAGTRSRIFI